MTALALLGVSLGAHAEMRTSTIDYEVDGQTFEGYMAYDDAQSGERPGVLVLHEWWGHTDYVRRRARMLAQIGYTAFAVDMYGDGEAAKHPDDAQKMMQAVTSDPAKVERRFDKAHDVLRAHPAAHPERSAAIGYCMGGGMALQMARAGKDLQAVVSFHATLDTDSPARKGDVKADLLVLTGGADPFVPSEQVAAFRKEMEAAGVDYRVHVYPEAKHGFTNPAADKLGEKFDLPLAYNEAADQDSWKRMKRLLAQRLKR
jgi:dienelactone hydrolase